MIALALGLAHAHPGMDDRLAAGAATDVGDCDVERWLSLARGFADEARMDEAHDAIARAKACGADPAVVALYAALTPTGRASLEALDAAVALNPDHVGVRLARSHLLASLGRTGDALADARQGLAAVDRPQPDDVLFLARLEPEPEAALAVLDDAIARIGPAPALVREAVILELALGRSIAALARLDGLPRTPTWLDLRATILLRSGATAEATDVWTEALAQTSVRSPAGRARADALRELLAAW